MRRALTALVAVATLAACTPRELQAWAVWHGQDPDAAVEFAQRPEVVADLATGEHETDGPQFRQYLDGSDGAWTAGDCDSFADEAADAGVPWGIFRPIMWRESGCDPTVWVVDRDDDGGAGFGFNYRGAMAGYWLRLCGMSKAEARAANVPLIMRCVAAEYRAHGLRAWR
jgi:hypothetical protein